MARGGSRIPSSLAGLAGAGVIAAHALGFRIAEPNAHARAHQMNETGHGHWGPLVMLGLAFLIATLSAHCIRVWRRPAMALPIRSLFMRLLSIQALGFASLEVIERTTAAGEFTLPAVDKAFVFGLLFQAVTATVGIVMLTLMTRAVKLLARALRRFRNSRHIEQVVATPPDTTLVATRVGTRGRTLRGPPRIVRFSL